MRITADRAELAEAVKWVSKATTTAGQWPALAGIRIDASDALDLTGHDQFTLHRATVPAVADEPGAAIVPALLLRDLLANLKGETVTLTSDKATTTLSAGRSKYDLRSHDPADYPDPPTGNDLTERGVVDAAEFAAAVSAVAWAADDEYPAERARGVRIEGDAGKSKGASLRVIGMQTAVAVVASIKWRKGHAFLVHMPIGQLAEAVTGLTGDLTVSTSESGVRLSTAAREVLLRTYAKPPVPFALPAWPVQATEIEPSELRAAVKRVSLTLARPEDPVQIEATEAGELLVNALGVTGDGFEHVGQISGAEFSDGFSARYLLGALSALPDGPALLAVEPVGQTRALFLSDKAGAVRQMIARRGKS